MLRCSVAERCFSSTSIQVQQQRIAVANQRKAREMGGTFRLSYRARDPNEKVHTYKSKASTPKPHVRLFNSHALKANCGVYFPFVHSFRTRLKQWDTVETIRHCSRGQTLSMTRRKSTESGKPRPSAMRDTRHGYGMRGSKTTSRESRPTQPACGPKSSSVRTTCSAQPLKVTTFTSSSLDAKVCTIARSASGNGLATCGTMATKLRTGTSAILAA